MAARSNFSGSNAVQENELEGFLET